MKHKNNEIRTLAKERSVHLWEIAQEYGCNDGNLSRKLRHELPESEKQTHIMMMLVPKTPR